MKLRVARSAVADLDDIWAYLAEKESVEVAERLVGLLTGRFMFLAKNPAAGRSRSELHKGLRSFPVGNHQIYTNKRKKASSEFSMSVTLHETRQSSSSKFPPLTLIAAQRDSLCAMTGAKGLGPAVTEPLMLEGRGKD